jgi:hypothetical protein
MLARPIRRAAGLTAHQDAAAIYRDTGDRHREAGALNNLSVGLRQAGRFGEAIPRVWLAIPRYRPSTACDGVRTPWPRLLR